MKIGINSVSVSQSPINFGHVIVFVDITSSYGPLKALYIPKIEAHNRILLWLRFLIADLTCRGNITGRPFDNLIRTPNEDVSVTGFPARKAITTYRQALYRMISSLIPRVFSRVQACVENIRHRDKSAAGL